MTKEQKYPLAEPASYAPPQMEVIPLRGNGMLCGSTLGQGVFSGTDPMTLTFSAADEEPGNTATDFYEVEDLDQGWGFSF